MIWNDAWMVTGDTTTGKLVIMTSTGQRIAITSASRRKLGVDVVKDDRPVARVEWATQLVRWIVQNMHSVPKQQRTLATDIAEDR